MLDLARDYGLMFLIGRWPNGPLGGLALTLALACSALLLALPAGLLLGLARVSPLRPLRIAVGSLVWLVRSVPLLMVVFWAYFFLPAITGVKTGQFATMLLALVLFNGIYLAEIVRAGVQAVPRGQMEAARALGLPWWTTLRHVLLPQALRHMLPSVVNQLVVTIKDTSLGYIIGLTEVAQVATQINAQVFTKAPEVYTALALTYFVLCFGLSRAAVALERRLGTARSHAGRRAGRPAGDFA